LKDTDAGADGRRIFNLDGGVFEPKLILENRHHLAAHRFRFPVAVNHGMDAQGMEP
jgi:hypothetical protein